MNGHPDSPDDSLVASITRSIAMAICFLISLICIGTTISHAANLAPAPNLSERNYYTDEVKIANPCMPTQILKFGQPGAPEQGYFEQLERCQNQSVLKTDYGALIQNDTLLYSNDTNGRIDGLATLTGPMAFPPVKAKGYLPIDAQHYAQGIAGALISYLDDQGRAGESMVFAQGNCLSVLTPALILPTWNMIEGAHFQYSYIHVVATNQTWCMNEP